MSAADWAQIFSIANGYALVMWLLLAFAPRNERLNTGLFYGGVGLLALAYAVLIIGLMTGTLDGGPTTGAPGMTTLAGVQALLSSDGGATVGWIHYLAFDLFVGFWIARNADAHGIARWLQIPFLAFTFILGPLGLLLYLLFRLTKRDVVPDAAVPS